MLDGNTLNGLGFPVPVRATCDGQSSSCRVDPVSSLVNDNATLIDQVKDALLPNQPPSLLWVAPSNGSEPLKSSIDVVATFPKTTSDNATYYCCNIYSATGNATITAARSAPKLVKVVPQAIISYPTYE